MQILRPSAVFRITATLVMMMMFIGMIPAANRRIKKKNVPNHAPPGAATTAAAIMSIIKGHAITQDAQGAAAMQTLTITKKRWRTVRRAALEALAYPAHQTTAILVMITMPIGMIPVEIWGQKKKSAALFLAAHGAAAIVKIMMFIMQGHAITKDASQAIAIPTHIMTSSCRKTAPMNVMPENALNAQKGLAVILPAAGLEALIINAGITSKR